jgi:hypothetical protein
MIREMTFSFRGITAHIRGIASHFDGIDSWIRRITAHRMSR